MLFYVLFIFYSLGVIRSALFLMKHSGNQSNNPFYYFLVIISVWFLAAYFCICTIILVIGSVVQAFIKAFSFSCE